MDWDGMGRLGSAVGAVESFFAAKARKQLLPRRWLPSVLMWSQSKPGVPPCLFRWRHNEQGSRVPTFPRETSATNVLKSSRLLVWVPDKPKS